MTRIVRALGALLPIVFAASCRDDSSARSSIAGASARVALAAATLSGQDAPLANEVEHPSYVGFDTGEYPDFTVIRLFVTPEGWVARYTGDAIATHIPPYEGAL